MIYLTVKQSPMYHQMSLEEFLFGTATVNTMINSGESNTRTYELDSIPWNFARFFDIPALIEILGRFNEKTEELRAVPRNELYHSFFIPKKSGGLRRIDAPNEELKNALRELKAIFEEDFKALYHTSAFAYVRGRSTVSAMKRHQANESKWFGKYDLTNFFGSTTMDFTMKTLSQIYPFSEVIARGGAAELKKALELGFLNGGLPQGTPLSPMLTNILMIPIDFKLSNTLRDFDKQRFIYTRYADDFQISSRYNFSFREIEKLIVDTLARFEAPFRLKSEKTRYGSSAGSNWNLGVMLNKDNEITVGHKKKKQFQTMLANYIMDKKNGVNWELNDVQTLDGYRNYYRMVEGENIDRIVAHIDSKFGTNVVALIKEDLKG